MRAAKAVNRTPWDRFLHQCRVIVPELCPECGALVDIDDPFCEEAFDAHEWYVASFSCIRQDDEDPDGEPLVDWCDWSMTFEKLIRRDPSCEADRTPGTVLVRDGGW